MSAARWLKGQDDSISTKSMEQKMMPITELEMMMMMAVHVSCAVVYKTRI